MKATVMMTMVTDAEGQLGQTCYDSVDHGHLTVSIVVQLMIMVTAKPMAQVAV